VRPRVLVSGLCLAVSLALPRTARADERVEARRHFRAGIQLVTQGRYREAIAEFEEANRILPNPNVLFNIARAYADANEIDRAIEYYTRYLSADVPDRADVEQVVRDLERRRRALAAPSPPTPPPPPPPPNAPTAATEAPPSVGSLSAEQLTALRSAAQTILQLTQSGSVGPAPASAPASAAPPPPPPAAPPPLAAPVGNEDAYEERLVTATLRAQSSLDSPNAVGVITAQDIRLSGATSLVELLRRTVGVDVAALDAGDHQVGIRGFNRRLNNRVMVLVDGRSISLDFIGLTL